MLMSWPWLTHHKHSLKLYQHTHTHTQSSSTFPSVQLSQCSLFRSCCPHHQLCCLTKVSPLLSCSRVWECVSMHARPVVEASESPLYIQAPVRTQRSFKRSLLLLVYPSLVLIVLSHQCGSRAHESQTSVWSVSTPRETWNHVYLWKSSIKYLGPFIVRGRFRSISRVFIKALSLFMSCVLKKTSIGSTYQQSMYTMTSCQRWNCGCFPFKIMLLFTL